MESGNKSPAKIFFISLAQSALFVFLLQHWPTFPLSTLRERERTGEGEAGPFGQALSYAVYKAETHSMWVLLIRLHSNTAQKALKSSLL